MQKYFATGGTRTCSFIVKKHEHYHSAMVTCYQWKHFCQKCFPTENITTQKYGNIGDGPDNRGNCFEYDASHPACEYEGYHCCNCKRLLTEKDDYRV